MHASRAFALALSGIALAAAQLWKPKFSLGRTLALTGGFAMLTVGVAGVMSLGNGSFVGH